MVMGCLQLNKRKHLLKKILSSQTSSKKKIRSDRLSQLPYIGEFY